MADLITPTAERESLGGGVYRTTISLAPIAYADASGVLRRIANEWSDGDGTYPHVVSAARMRVRTAPNGDRLLLPVPGDDQAWFSISSPYINVGGNWTQPSLGSFTRSGHTLTAQTANVDTRIDHAGHYIKAEFELKNGWTPNNGQFAFRVGLNGLTRDGGTLLYDGSPVMALRAPVAYDADNEQDTRTIAHEFVQLGGNWYVLFTLPSLAGMARPVVDPTFTAQPDATAGEDDGMLEVQPTWNLGVRTTIWTTHNRKMLLRFDASSIAAGATCTAATLYLYAASAPNVDASIVVHQISDANGDWAEGAKNGAAAGAGEPNWNYKDAGATTAWAGSAGLSTSGTDYDASSMGSYTHPSTANSGDELSTALDTTTVQGWFGDASNNGMVVFDSATTDGLCAVNSSDNATAAQRPKLVIEYTEPAAGPPIAIISQYRRRRGI